MKNFYSTLLLAGLLLTLLGSKDIEAQPNWTYYNTGANASIILLDTMECYINELAIESGDYIGVFYYDDNNVLQCGGYVEWQGAITSIPARGWEWNSPVKNGFDTGEEFKFFIWDASASQEYPAVATFVNNGSGTGYVTNHVYIVESLYANTNLLTDVTSVSCNGLSDGAIDLMAIFGQAPYSFLWSNGAITEDVSGLAAGSYSVTVTDALNVVETLSLTVPEPAALVVNVLANEANAFMCEAQAEAFGAGGTDPYVYQWDDPNLQTTSLATNLCPGTYMVDVSDANGCSANASAIISVGSTAATDSAFTLIDTCLVNPVIDTAYVSELYYSASGLMIVWTVISISADTGVFDMPYPSITNPGTFYIGLAINCATKSMYTTETTQLYAVVEITPQILGLVDESATANEFYAYPNPVGNLLNVELPAAELGLLRVQVFNALGSVVIDKEVQAEGLKTRVGLDVSDLYDGMYILRVSNKTKSLFVQKILK